MNAIKLKDKKIIIAVVLILIISIVIYYEYKYLPEQNKKIKILEYKKEFYNSILCEYNCPLKLQEYKNKTQLLPEAVCVKSCTKDFKKNNNSTAFSSIDLNQDNLIIDINKLVQDCKKQSLNSTTLSIDNSVLFSCSVKSLKTLRQKYDYLV